MKKWFIQHFLIGMIKDVFKAVTMNNLTGQCKNKTSKE